MPACRGQSAADLILDMQKEGQQWPERRVYVLVHSIDGPGVWRLPCLCLRTSSQSDFWCVEGLRAQGEQAVLAALAACPNVHMAASCDHVNSADLWSTALALQFRCIDPACTPGSTAGQAPLRVPCHPCRGQVALDQGAHIRTLLRRDCG